VIAGPTAREREDKRDWSVEADAAELIVANARRMYPALERVQPIGSYAGLRPAGRGANYVIERSRALPALVHVAAIRSTGLSASLAIGEHVAGMLADDGAISPAPVRALPAPDPLAPAQPPPPATPTPTPTPGDGSRPGSPGAWWERAARRSRTTSSSPSQQQPGRPPRPA
jgi:glycerol-3-phosphate dehydrogenase